MNHKAQVHVKRNGHVACFSASFNKSQSLISMTSYWSADYVIDEKMAIQIAEFSLNIPAHSHPVKKVLLETSKGDYALSFVVQLRNQTHWLEAYIDAFSKNVIQIVNFSFKSTYRSIPFTSSNPNQGFKSIYNPEHYPSSPLGWQNDGSQTYNVTKGNNADVFTFNSANWTLEEFDEYLSSNHKQNLSFQIRFYSSSGQNDSFITEFDPKQDPSDYSNANSSMNNLFYVINSMHDLMYEFGFTESSGNFQHFNFGRGGLEHDRVEVSSQDPSEENNASFDSPPGIYYL